MAPRGRPSAFFPFPRLGLGEFDSESGPSASSGTQSSRRPNSHQAICQHPLPPRAPPPPRFGPNALELAFPRRRRGRNGQVSLARERRAVPYSSSRRRVRASKTALDGAPARPARRPRATRARARLSAQVCDGGNLRAEVGLDGEGRRQDRPRRRRAPLLHFPPTSQRRRRFPSSAPRHLIRGLGCVISPPHSYRHRPVCCAQPSARSRPSPRW